MHPAVVLAALALVLACCSESCQPGYWEVDAEFRAPTTEVWELATKSFLLSDVQKSTGIFPNRSSYTVRNISVRASYTQYGRELTFLEDEIRHVNQTLSLVVSYNVDKNKKDYSGTGTATLQGISINFTTVRNGVTQRILVRKGVARYELDNNSLSFNLPNSLTPGAYSPEPSAADKEIFDELVRKDLYSELSFIYNTTLTISLNDIISGQALELSYPNPYTYTSKQFTLNYDMGIAQVALLGERGVTIGGVGSIITAEPYCSQVVPPNSSAHYYTRGMVTQLLRHAVSSSPEWMPLQLNWTNTVSPYFQFYVNELESIIPNAVLRYPDFTERFVVVCAADSSQEVVLDADQQLANASLMWHCSLRHTSGDTLASFATKLSYSVAVVSSLGELRTVVKRIVLDALDWRETPGYPIKMKSLAALFLKSALDSYIGRPTLGDGFLQPLPGNVQTTIHEDYIEIVPDTTRSVAQ